MGRMGKRVALAVLLLAVVGVAGCGGPPDDVTGDLQQAIERRDDAAYATTLSTIEKRGDLKNADLETLAAALSDEIHAGLAWPDSHYPSAPAILRGSSNPVPWILKGCEVPAELRELGAHRHPVPARGEPPYLPGDPRLLQGLVQLLDHDVPAEQALHAGQILALFSPDDRMGVADQLIKGLAHPYHRVCSQSRLLLSSLGARVVPSLAERLRASRSTWEAHQVAWTLATLGPEASGARSVLEDQLSAADWHARMFSAVALLKIEPGHPGATRVLLRDLLSADPNHSETVAFAITHRVPHPNLLRDLKRFATQNEQDERAHGVIQRTIEDLRVALAREDTPPR